MKAGYVPASFVIQRIKFLQKGNTKKNVEVILIWKMCLN